MNAGPCPECGEELALDQRYCINCGHRAETSLAPSYHPVFDGMGERGDARRGFPIPIPIATTFAAATLAFGVVMGTAISPNLSGLVAGEHISGPTVVQAPAPEPEKEKGAATDAEGLERLRRLERVRHELRLLRVLREQRLVRVHRRDRRAWPLRAATRRSRSPTTPT